MRIKFLTELWLIVSEYENIAGISNNWYWGNQFMPPRKKQLSFCYAFVFKSNFSFVFRTGVINIFMPDQCAFEIEKHFTKIKNFCQISIKYGLDDCDQKIVASWKYLIVVDNRLWKAKSILFFQKKYEYRWRSIFSILCTIFSRRPKYRFFEQRFFYWASPFLLNFQLGFFSI